jgi:hypothetical protein
MSFMLVPLRQLRLRRSLGFSSASVCREDTGLSLAEAAFGTPLVLPNEFLQNGEFSVDQIIKKFAKVIDTAAFSLPSKHNMVLKLLDELPVHFLHAPLACMHLSSIFPPLQRPYGSPYVVLKSRARSFTIRFRTWDEVISVSRLKPFTDADAEPSQQPLELPSRHPRIVFS